MPRQKASRAKTAHSQRSPAAERLTLTVEEAARMLGIGRNQAYAAVEAGQIPSVRIGEKRILIPKAGLAQMLACTKAS